MKKAVLNLPDDELSTWNGLRGIWRTIKGHKIFFPNGEDTEKVMKEQLEKYEDKKESKFADVTHITEEAIENDRKEMSYDKTKGKQKVFKFTAGDVTFEGHTGSIMIEKKVREKIEDFQKIENLVQSWKKEGREMKEAEREMYEKAKKQSGQYLKAIKAASTAWNKLPQEYRNDVDRVEFKSKVIGESGKVAGTFKPVPTKTYRNKIELGVLDPDSMAYTLRHEIAHARWHKMSEEWRKKLVNEMWDSEIVGHTPYAKSFIEKVKNYKKGMKEKDEWWKKTLPQSHNPKSDLYRIRGNQMKEYEEVVERKKELWVNEIHSEWFAVRDYPEYRDSIDGEAPDMDQFKKIGKKFESVFGKAYMEKAMIINDLIRKYNKEGYEGDFEESQELAHEEIIFDLDKNMIMTEDKAKAKYQSIYGIDKKGKLLIHALLPYGENGNNKE